MSSEKGEPNLQSFQEPSLSVNLSVDMSALACHEYMSALGGPFLSRKLASDPCAKPKKNIGKT